MEICLWCEDNQGWCPAAGEGEQEDPMLTPGPFSAPYITSPSDRVSSLGLLFIHPPTKLVSACDIRMGSFIECTDTLFVDLF